jgi:hypothetical protein
MSGDQSLREVIGGVETAAGPLRDVLGTLLGEQSWRVPERELLDALGALHRLRGLVDAAQLRVVREIDARGVTGAVGSAPVATTTEALVREVTGAAPAAARRDVAAARVTGPGDVLAGFGERLAGGRWPVAGCVGSTSTWPCGVWTGSLATCSRGRPGCRGS